MSTALMDRRQDSGALMVCLPLTEGPVSGCSRDPYLLVRPQLHSLWPEYKEMLLSPYRGI